MSVGDNNCKAHCLPWRNTEMDPIEVDELTKIFEAVEEKANRRSSSTIATASSSRLFYWKMQLGKWGHNQHWFLRDIMPPQNNLPGHLTVHLMAVFLPPDRGERAHRGRYGGPNLLR
ncbi:hypothetical protein ON010_g6985 [Phytophthora cinnamomi]|nr:hypothetical protein ON010_g6985 [Phytophthora cinnamomi]